MENKKINNPTREELRQRFAAALQMNLPHQQLVLDINDIDSIDNFTKTLCGGLLNLYKADMVSYDAALTHLSLITRCAAYCIIQGKDEADFDENGDLKTTKKQ